VGHVQKLGKQSICWNTLQWLHKIAKPLEIK